MNKTVVITGGASGQGRSHALAFANIGYDIVIGDISDPNDINSNIHKTLQEIKSTGTNVIGLYCDVRNPEDVENLFARAAEEYTTIDIVVANAGIMLFGMCWELSEEDVRKTIDINLIGVWRTNKEALKYMIRQKSGRIINISSTAGLKPPSSGVHYAMSKYGVIGLTKTAAREVAGLGITINAICPTMVRTPMTERKEFVQDLAKDLGMSFITFEEMNEILSKRRPMGIAFIEPEDVSNMCIWLATSKEAKLITGAALPIDAGSML